MSHHAAGWRWDYKKGKWTGGVFTLCQASSELHLLLCDFHLKAFHLYIVFVSGIAAGILYQHWPFLAENAHSFFFFLRATAYYNRLVV